MERALIEAGQRLAVFMPNYNHGRFLPTAIEAVLAQSVQPREICILDDASSDDSRRIIAEYAARHPHIRPVFRDHNAGVVRCQQEFLAQSTDEFVFFAAADDMVLPGLIERSLALLVAHPQAGLCSAQSRLMDEAGRDLGPFLTPRPLPAGGYITPELAASVLMTHDSWFLGNTTIYRREALLAAGGFDQSLAGFSDGYVSRVIALTRGACFITDDLAYWRRTHLGFSAQTIGSVETAKRVADRAVALMQTDHAQAFPAGYAQRWRRRWLFSTAMALAQGATYEARAAGLSSLFAPTHALQRVGVALLALLPQRLAAPVLLATMRPRDVWSVLRRRVLAPASSR